MNQHDNRERDDEHGERKSAPNTGFLDLEISKVLYAEAESITREAFRDLLREAAKKRWQERFGNEIEALAQQAVDELIADIEANLKIEAVVAERARNRQTSISWPER